MTETSWIVLLRGINVGGHGKLPMAAFRDLLRGLCYADVATYIQSGNAVFRADGDGPAIEAAIADAVDAAFGFRPPCLAMTRAQLEAAIAANPYPGVADPRFLHLVFTRGEVELDADGLQQHCTQGEEFSLRGEVLYLHTPRGFGRSKVAAKLSRHLAAAATTARNLRSCQKILALAGG